MTTHSVLIAGGGIGGLTAALGLQRAGFKVTVLERSAELREIGAGVSLAPNATRSLASLGVLAEVRSRSNVANAAAIKHYRTGERLSGYDMGPAMEARWGAPYLMIHRAELQSILAGAVRRNDPEAIRLGVRVEGFAEQHDHVIAKSAAGQMMGDCLIAADGVRSTIRTQLHGDAAPHFLGYVAWRGVVPLEALPGAALDPDTAVFLGPKQSLLRYLLGGREFVNVVMFSQHDAWAGEGWTVPADPAEIRAAFHGWAPEAASLVEAVCRGEVFKWGLFGRRPLPSWGRGRVSLIGDAAHPMLPFLGQGAAMAIEDGVLLARAFGASSDPVDALALYERARFQRATATVARANEQGLKIHGYFVDAPLGAPVPRDDFAEYEFDASTVALPV